MKFNISCSLKKGTELLRTAITPHVIGSGGGLLTALFSAR
jgi:hypothetical protein